LYIESLPKPEKGKDKLARYGGKTSILIKSVSKKKDLSDSYIKLIINVSFARMPFSVEYLRKYINLFLIGQEKRSTRHFNIVYYNLIDQLFIRDGNSVRYANCVAAMRRSNYELAEFISMITDNVLENINCPVGLNALRYGVNKSILLSFEMVSYRHREHK